MGRSDFHERQERRKERLEARAKRAQAESDAAFARADEIGKGIPLGQPILVGHHSERGHRADLRRIDRAMRKSVDKRAEAKELARRAGRVGSGGVSSDDPDATQKLDEKLRRLEDRHAARKAINAAWRKAGKPSPDEAARWAPLRDACGLSADALQQLRLQCAKHWYMHAVPYPAYVQKNANAEIRRLKGRIEELAELSGTEHTEVDHGVCRVLEDPDDNRLRVEFDGKPAPEVRALLKREGFRWSPTAGAWQRKLSDGARHAARRVVSELTTGE